MNERSILFKLTAGYAAIVLIALLIVGLIFTGYFRADIFNSRTSSMKDRGQQIAKLAREQILDSRDPAEIETIRQLLSSMAGARILISDKNGVIVLDTAASPGTPGQTEDMPTVGPLLERILAGVELAEEVPFPVESETYLAVGVPVRSQEGGITGAVLLLSPSAGMAAMVDQASYLLGAAILLALLLTILMSYFYARLFTRPLQTMQRAAMEMARGNFESRVALNSGDEIGRLGEALDLLATRLGYTIDQLYQEQNKLQDLFASISEGILAYDPGMRLLSYNQAALAILGCDHRNGWESSLLAKIEAGGLSAAFNQVMTNGERFQTTGDWNQLALNWIISPIVNSRGEILGSVALIRDISESENLERMRREFVANVSHELRTPLTVIRGSAEALLDGAVSSPEDIGRYNRRILQEIRGLERLVNDLLELNQLQSGHLVLQVEKLDPAALVRDVAQALEPVARQKGIELENLVTGSLPPIYGDYDRLRQLLVIFIDNAIRHSPEHSRVWIEAGVQPATAVDNAAGGGSDDASRLRIAISDNGPGIAPEDLPRIWDRFYKADRSRRHAGGGTGLGLSIARSLAELHGGSVVLESVYGQGTSVTIELPPGPPENT